MRIREAAASDAVGIAKVHVDSWKTTYKGIIPDSYLASLSYAKRTALWKKNLTDNQSYIVIAENEKREIIGFATALGKQTTDKLEHEGHLTSIYLLDEHQGKGIGKQLLKEVFRYFIRLSIRTVYVAVLEENPTKYFYEKYGAELAETVEIHIGGKALQEHIFVWRNLEEINLIF